MRDFTDKVAFVTGGVSGIGLGIAEALLDRGAHFDGILAACPAPQDIDPGRQMLEDARRSQTAAALRAVEALTASS